MNVVKGKAVATEKQLYVLTELIPNQMIMIEVAMPDKISQVYKEGIPEVERRFKVYVKDGMAINEFAYVGNASVSVTTSIILFVEPKSY